MIHVVAAAVTDARGRILIAQRPPGRHLAGGWEFPGGKLEPSEPRAVGLARELREELGIAIRDPRPLLRVRHTYSYGPVLIDMWVVTRYEGEPHGVDGQALRWCTPLELAAVELLPADRPIVRTLRLPERLTARTTPIYSVGVAQTAAPADAPPPELRGAWCAIGTSGAASAPAASAAAAAARGADFLVLGEPLAAAQLEALCSSVRLPVYARGIGLEEAWRLGASGVNEIRDQRAGCSGSTP